MSKCEQAKTQACLVLRGGRTYAKPAGGARLRCVRLLSRLMFVRPLGHTLAPQQTHVDTLGKLEIGSLARAQARLWRSTMCTFACCICLVQVEWQRRIDWVGARAAANAQMSRHASSTRKASLPAGPSRRTEVGGESVHLFIVSVCEAAERDFRLHHPTCPAASR